MSLRDHSTSPILTLCADVDTAVHPVQSALNRFLNFPLLAEKIRVSEEIETDGWTIRKMSMKDGVGSAVLAYDGAIVRCLCVKVEENQKPISALYFEMQEVEAHFVRWINRLIENHIEELCR